MPTEPTVCAVMLTADRPEMARRAVECFRAQAYERKWLVVWDSGVQACGIEAARGIEDNELWIREAPSGTTIGKLRNSLIRVAGSADIIVHFDDDDYSHPNRIAEQVALLQSSGADAVGYHEMLFWRNAARIEREVLHLESEYHDYAEDVLTLPQAHGEAWLYTGSILGTSLCYWRETWERVPFRESRLNPNHEQGTGEDADFLLDLAAKGMKTAQQSSVPMRMEQARALAFPEGPRMIAGIHGANTSKAYDPAQMRAHPQHWTRVPAWDQFCLETMK